MKFLFILFIVGISIFSFSQEQRQGINSKGNMNGLIDKMKVGHFYGKIVDSISGKGIEYAVVRLIGNKFDTVNKTIKKDVLIVGQLTKANGDFSLENISVVDNFTLKISAIGYETKTQKVSFNINIEKIMPDKDFGNIKLKRSSTQLKEVTIEATVPVMELKPDKKIFNVEKSMVSTGGTAEDVLKQVPSVSVNIDGEVTLRNTSPQIFIDGNPSTLTIDQIPADAIKSIEIITNPSAKYDASGGQAGILNIVLKKEKRMGYNGNIYAGIDQRRKVNAGIDINARERKINAFFNGNFNQRYSITEGKTERENLIGNPVTNIFQNQYSISDGLHEMVRAGFDWFMDNRNTFTISGKYMQGNSEPSDEFKTKIDTMYPTYTNTTSYNRTTNTQRVFSNKGGAFQYKHLFPKEGKELTGDLNYNKSLFTTEGNYDSKYYDAYGNFTGVSIIQNLKGNGYNEMFTGQSDFMLPLNTKNSAKKDKSKIETGVRVSYKNFSTQTKNFLKNNSTGEFDFIKNQYTNYKFTDQIYAAYFTYDKQKEKFSYQIGLRSESSFYMGKMVDINQTFKNYFPISLFPSTSITYKINKNDNLQSSYSRRINRPSFFQMIPFINYSDSLNLSKGNAGLKPELTHAIELSYLKIINQTNNVLATIYFNTSNGLITNYQMSEYNSALQKNTIINTYQNANASYVYGGEITNKSTVKKWLDITLNINAYYSIIDAKNIQAYLINKQFSWFTKGNITFKLPKNINIQLNPEYHSRASVPVLRGDNGGGYMGMMGRAPIVTAQGYVKAKFNIDVAIKYTFMKNNAASISINVRDIFASDINEIVTNSDYFNQVSSRLRDSRFVRVNFSYRFGKFDASLFKRKNNKVNMEGMQEIQGM